jgi:SET domain-containing protein
MILNKEVDMPKLKEIDINYDQICELVCQLEFKKKMSLIKQIIKEKEYKNSFYTYTESLLKKYNIPGMNENELDTFLHQKD